MKLDTQALRVAVFSDNDFGKTNGVTTTWRAVLSQADASQSVRIYTASDASVEQPDYLSVASFGVGLPWYREMRIYLPAVRRFMRQVVNDGITVVHVATPGPVGLAGRWIARRAGPRPAVRTVPGRPVTLLRRHGLRPGHRRRYRRRVPPQPELPR